MATLADLSTADFLDPGNYTTSFTNTVKQVRQYLNSKKEDPEPEIKEKQQNEQNGNFKYENGRVSFIIEEFIRKLFDINGCKETFFDGKDKKYRYPIDVKSCLFETKNYIWKVKKTYNSAGKFIFYRNNHLKLKKENGKYIFTVYSYSLEGDDSNIFIHAIKTVDSSRIDPIIEKSLSKSRVAISWKHIFSEIHSSALFEIPREVSE